MYGAVQIDRDELTVTLIVVRKNFLVRYLSSQQRTNFLLTSQFHMSYSARQSEHWNDVPALTPPN